MNIFLLRVVYVLALLMVVQLSYSQGIQFKGGFSYAKTELVNEPGYQPYGKNILTYQLYLAPEFRLFGIFYLEPSIGYVGKAYKLEPTSNNPRNLQYKGVNYFIETPLLLKIKVPIDQYNESFLGVSGGLYYSWGMGGDYSIINHGVDGSTLKEPVEFNNHAKVDPPFADMAKNLYGYKVRGTLDIGGFLLYFEYSKSLNDIRTGERGADSGIYYNMLSGGVGFMIRN